MVVADDLAAWMLGCYGNKEIKTPNIDLLARGGVRFLNNFVVTPVCSASRATLFTGRTPRQHGIHDFLTPNPIERPPQGQAAPPASFANEIMISDALAGAGYRCGYTGKWHMGGDESRATATDSPTPWAADRAAIRTPPCIWTASASRNTATWRT